LTLVRRKTKQRKIQYLVILAIVLFGLTNIILAATFRAKIQEFGIDGDSTTSYTQKENSLFIYYEVIVGIDSNSGFLRPEWDFDYITSIIPYQTFYPPTITVFDVYNSVLDFKRGDYSNWPNVRVYTCYTKNMTLDIDEAYFSNIYSIIVRVKHFRLDFAVLYSFTAYLGVLIAGAILVSSRPIDEQKDSSTTPLEEIAEDQNKSFFSFPLSAIESKKIIEIGSESFTPGKCQICKLELRKGQEIMQCTYCLAQFHKNHLLNWLMNDSHCPVCYEDFKK